jgi:RNA polymerase primary sigma factor
MLLSHLNERMLMQEIGIDAVMQGLAENVDKITSGTETGNLDIARRLENAKFQLINALARFPVAALWILNKYEQTIDSSEQDTDIVSTEKCIDVLKNLKKHDLIASQLVGENCNYAEYSDEKQSFIDVFRAFPFSFEDLIELTDLVVYAFQSRGLCYQVTGKGVKKSTKGIVKRLKHLKRLNQSTLSDELKVLRLHDEQCLFYSENVMYQYVIETVVAEHLWLTARQQLVEKNAKLVLFIANQYKGGFLDFDDLVQEGQTGLLKAVDKFDYHLGCQFSTYAAYWIRQRISRALSRNERVVRVPCEQVSNINKLFRAKDELLVTTGKEATVEELANHLNVSSNEINAMLSISQTTLPLENFDSDDEVLAPIDMIEQQVFEPAFKQVAQSELKSWLTLAIKTLNSRESTVICCHFGINTNNEMTLQEIGTELNISRERVRQIQVMAFNKMKLNYGEQLVSFL